MMQVASLVRNMVNHVSTPSSSQRTPTRYTPPLPELGSEMATELSRSLSTSFPRWGNANAGRGTHTAYQYLITVATDATEARRIFKFIQAACKEAVKKVAHAARVKVDSSLRGVDPWQRAYPNPGATPHEYCPLTEDGDERALRPDQEELAWYLGHKSLYKGDPGHRNDEMTTCLTHIYEMRTTVSWLIVSSIIDGINSRQILDPTLRLAAGMKVQAMAPDLMDSDTNPRALMGSTRGIHLKALHDHILAQLREVPQGSLATLVLVSLLRFAEGETKETTSVPGWLRRIANAANQARLRLIAASLPGEWRTWSALDGAEWGPDPNHSETLPLSMVAQTILLQCSLTEAVELCVRLTQRALYHRAQENMSQWKLHQEMVANARAQAPATAEPVAGAEAEPGNNASLDNDSIQVAVDNTVSSPPHFPEKFIPPAHISLEAFLNEARTLVRNLNSPGLGTQVIYWLSLDDFHEVANEWEKDNPHVKEPTEVEKLEWAAAMKEIGQRPRESPAGDKAPTKDEVAALAYDASFMVNIAGASQEESVPCAVCLAVWSKFDRIPSAKKTNHKSSECNYLHTLQRPPHGRPHEGGRGGGRGGERGAGRGGGGLRGSQWQHRKRKPKPQPKPSQQGQPSAAPPVPAPTVPPQQQPAAQDTQPGQRPKSSYSESRRGGRGNKRKRTKKKGEA